MKIAAIEARRIALSLKDWTPSRNATGLLTLPRPMAVCAKVTTDDGLTGYGTAAGVPGYSGMTQDIILDGLNYLAPLLVGFDPFDVEQIHSVMNNKLLGNTAAKSAIDIAIFDVMGKSARRPVHQLIGGRVREDFVTDRALKTENKDVREVVRSAVSHHEEGYRGFEIHTGLDLQRNIDVVKGVRDALPDVVIIADPHAALSVKESIRQIKALERYDLYFEQPTKGIDKMAEVKRSVDATITADDDCFTVEDAVSIIAQRAADCLTVKIPKAGGVYPARKIVTLAESAGLSVRVDGLPGDTKISNTAGAHLALTVKNLMPGSGVMQHRYWLREDFSLSGGLVFKDGRVSVPDDHGIGVVPNEALIERGGAPVSGIPA